ncbi:MAG: hypothetical protein K8F30_00175 [Taibaiella sp.]|nr:hypothetical protein [Taibaiella sp.]
MSDTATAFKEKALKERIEKGANLYLRLTWDSEAVIFKLAAEDVKGITKYAILTWKGAPKTFKDPVLAIGWAKEFGFTGVRWDEVIFSA